MRQNFLAALAIIRIKPEPSTSRIYMEGWVAVSLIGVSYGPGGFVGIGPQTLNPEPYTSHVDRAEGVPWHPEHETLRARAVKVWIVFQNYAWLWNGAGIIVSFFSTRMGGWGGAGPAVPAFDAFQEPQAR